MKVINTNAFTVELTRDELQVIRELTQNSEEPEYEKQSKIK